MLRPARSLGYHRKILRASDCPHLSYKLIATSHTYMYGSWIISLCGINSLRVRLFVRSAAYCSTDCFAACSICLPYSCEDIRLSVRSWSPYSQLTTLPSGTTVFSGLEALCYTSLGSADNTWLGREHWLPRSHKAPPKSTRTSSDSTQGGHCISICSPRPWCHELRA